ncbi:MAG: 5'-nucleotidase C-terminal domain-containing protein [Chitinophagales bacterium]
MGLSQHHSFRRGTRNALFPALFLLSLVSCTYYYSPASRETAQVRVNETIAPDTAIEHIIAPYKEALDAEMNDVVAVFGMDMRKAKPESQLGNFVCDAVLAQGEKIYDGPVDFAVYNYGGIRIDNISAGPVTRGKIFELLPFENFGAIVTLDGSATAQLFRKIIAEDGWPVGGVTLTIHSDYTFEAMIGNTPFDSTRSYHIIMNDYMANGGDDLSFIPAENVVFLKTTIRDMVLDYLRFETEQGRTIQAKVEGRITYAE